MYCSAWINNFSLYTVVFIPIVQNKEPTLCFFLLVSVTKKEHADILQKLVVMFCCRRALEFSSGRIFGDNGMKEIAYSDKKTKLN